ncbi:MAG: hypothetical protein WEB33_05380 [Bacteroidota bacterium]
MSGSFVFLLHLVGFSLVSALVIAGWILNSRFVNEKDLTLKLYVGGLSRVFSFISPLAALLLLVSGIGNIYNLYYGTTVAWYEQGWLVIKVVLFGVMLVNGLIFGPIMSKKRMKVVQEMTEVGANDDNTKILDSLNSQMRWFFLVQSVLLLGILFFSAFGTSKHPGYF